ncbi:VOC family protein [Actinomadura madurae]|uniref:VOC family protein n=1 Tax=Actinomadura madurae TaxID=1993 RepID=UPI000D919FC8|nr:VOC family protein [Actinomadura madurae]SPT59094.1 3-methylcatechol 2,3-dioxygenase [Actinomadura madurae]
MGHIKSLGYIGVGADDLTAWREFGTGVLGLQVGEAGADDDTLYFRMDGRSYRIAVHKSTHGALHYFGFEISTREELADFAEQLHSKGVEVTEEGAELCAARRVSALRSATDPMGNRLEFFVGHEEATAPFVSPTGAQFVIDDMGLGHAFITCDDIEVFKDFYIGKLGFRLSDTVSLTPGAETHFLRCNTRHHTLAGVAIPGRLPSLHHIMLQVASIDTVGHAYDNGGGMVDLTLGKHTNDHMISCFFKTPSDFVVEYGFDGRQVDDDTWVVGHYTAASYWGHRRPEAMTGANEPTS